MKKGSKLLLRVCPAVGLAIAYAMTLISCVSYGGQIDNSVPLSEQATIKLHPYLNLAAFDGKDTEGFVIFTIKSAGTMYVNVPAGEHTITFNYLSQSSSGNYTTTSYANGIKVEAELEAGYTYYAQVLYLPENRIGVSIVEEKTGEPKDTWTGLETRTPVVILGLGLQTIPYEYDDGKKEYFGGGDAAYGYQIGQVFDGKTRSAWHIDIGGGFLLSNIGFYTGAAYEYYIPKTNIGFSAGGGIKGLYAGLYGGDAFTLFPYIEFRFIPFLFQKKLQLGVYANYNLSNSVPIYGGSSMFDSDVIGLGIFFAR